jgi:hypothetical protein
MGITKTKARKREERYQIPVLRSGPWLASPSPAWDTFHANGNHADHGKVEGGDVPEPSPEEWDLVGLTDPA